jgi:hypothetical protein
MNEGASAITDSDVVTRLIPGGATCLAQLSDDELLANTRRLVGKSNQLLAALLLHLAEVEVRGVHRRRRCASLYTYCIYELRFSEDAAARRSAAARFVKEFPALLKAVADGELHLTGLLMIGPHLTPENQAEVLGRARFRTKKELAKLIRELNPLPRVPDLVQPLGPQPMRRLRAPTWAEFVESFCPLVRELPLGERPREWANDSEVQATGAESELPVGPAPANLPPVTGPQHYQLQFETSEEHVELIERAKALMARERPGVTLGQLHLEAMKLLVASLEKRKFAIGAIPRQSGTATGDETAPHRHGQNPAPRRRGTATDTTSAPRQRRTAAEDASAPRQRAIATDDASAPRRRGRYIPAAVRREVYARDEGRCGFVDDRGERCCETRYLELHHLEPFARGGVHSAKNLALRCAAHNQLAAEDDFGADRIIARKDAARHESLSRQRSASPRDD